MKLEKEVQNYMTELGIIDDQINHLGRLRITDVRRQRQYELSQQLINLSDIVVRSVDKLLTTNSGYLTLLQQQLKSSEDQGEKEIKTIIKYREDLQIYFIGLKDGLNDALLHVQVPVGLTPARIEKFHRFKADETFNGERCVCCMDDFQVGKKLVRLDCDHVLCKKCADVWFQKNKSCQTCRHPHY